MGLPRPPFDLLLDGDLVARVLDYGYETPWATGRCVPVPGTPGEQLAGASALSRLADSDDDDDAAWEAARTRLGLTEADLDRLSRGLWTMRDAAGVIRSLSTPDLDDAGWLTWRWYD